MLTVVIATEFDGSVNVYGPFRSDARAQALADAIDREGKDTDNPAHAVVHVLAKPFAAAVPRAQSKKGDTT